MTATDQPTPLGIARILCFVAGAAIYVISFFLPAAEGSQSTKLPGYMCAFLSLNPLLLGKPLGWLAFAAGLLNPIVLCYAAAWIAGARGKARLLLAGGTVVSIAAAVGFLILAKMMVYSGFFAWSLSALMMTGGDLLDGVSRWVAAGVAADSPISGQ